MLTSGTTFACSGPIWAPLGPTLFRRLEPGTAGTVGFLIRLVTMAVVTGIALRVGGFRIVATPRDLADGPRLASEVLEAISEQVADRGP
jgi:hypothetical protein